MAKMTDSQKDSKARPESHGYMLSSRTARRNSQKPSSMSSKCHTRYPLTKATSILLCLFDQAQCINEEQIRMMKEERQGEEECKPMVKPRQGLDEQQHVLDADESVPRSTE